MDPRLDWTRGSSHSIVRLTRPATLDHSAAPSISSQSSVPLSSSRSLPSFLLSIIIIILLLNSHIRPLTLQRSQPPKSVIMSSYALSETHKTVRGNPSSPIPMWITPGLFNGWTNMLTHNLALYRCSSRAWSSPTPRSPRS